MGKRPSWECGLPARKGKNRRARNPPRPYGPPLQGGELFYPLSGGVPRSGGVGFFVVTLQEPPPAFGHPSKEGMVFCGREAHKKQQARCRRSQGGRKGSFSIPSWEGCRASGGVGFAVVTCQEPTPALRATPPRRGWFSVGGKPAENSGQDACAPRGEERGAFLSPLGRGAAKRRGGFRRSDTPGTHPGLRPPLRGGDGFFLSPLGRGAAERRGGFLRSDTPGTHPGLRPPLQGGDGRRCHLG